MLRQHFANHASHHYVIKTALLCTVASGIWSGIKTSHMPNSTSDMDAVGEGAKPSLYAMKTVVFGLDHGANTFLNPSNSTGGKLLIGTGEVIGSAIISPFVVLPAIGSVVGGGVGGLIGNHHHSDSQDSGTPKEPDRPIIKGIPTLPVSPAPRK